MGLLSVSSCSKSNVLIAPEVRPACSSSLSVQELLDNTNESLQEIRSLYVESGLRGTPQGDRFLAEFNEVYEMIYKRKFERLIEACERAHTLEDSLSK